MENSTPDQEKHDETPPTEIESVTLEPKSVPASSRRNLIILIVTIILMLALSAFAYFFFTKTWIFAENHAEVLDAKPIFSKEDYPKFDASTATQPLVMAFYKNFTGNTSAKTTDFDFTMTHDAYVRLVNKEVDLIVVTQPSEDELKLIADAGDEFVVTPVVNEGFVFFVNRDNPVNSLTVEQIQDIYSGKITNWKELGGSDSKIVAFQREVNSGSQTGMLKIVMKDKPLMKPIREDMVIGTMVAIVASVVAEYDNAPNAIGYSYYYYVTTMYQDIDADIADNIKLLSINGVKPEPKTIQDSSYPFTTSYYIVTRKSDEKNENIQKLKDAMLSPRGQKVAEEAMYVPIR